LAHIETDKGIELAPPGWFREYFRKGDIYLCQEKIAQAAEHLRKLFDFEVTLPIRWGRDRLGKVYLFQGKFQDAQMEFRKGAEFSKKAREKIWEAEFLLSLARLFHKTGNNTGALGEHDRAWSLAVETENLGLKRKVLYIRGLIQLEKGLIDKAQKTADEMRLVVETDLNNTAKSTYHHLMGKIGLHKKNNAEAIECFDKALSFLSYSPRTWDADIIDSLATAYYRSGDTENAIKEYEKITMLSTGKIDYGDTYAKAFYMLGKIFEQQGDTAKAIEHYEKFLNLWKDADPGIAEVADARRRLSELIHP
jgi:tetratricopeptide (TPR) repeat protein